MRTLALAVVVAIGLNTWGIESAAAHSRRPTILVTTSDMQPKGPPTEVDLLATRNNDDITLRVGLTEAGRVTFRIAGSRHGAELLTEHPWCRRYGAFVVRCRSPLSEPDDLEGIGAEMRGGADRFEVESLSESGASVPYVAVDGNAGRDLIRASRGVSAHTGAYGGFGDDRIIGQAFAYGQIGNDVLKRVSNAWGDEGTDTLIGTAANDVLRGGPGGDLVIPRGGRDTVRSQGGPDTIDTRDGSPDTVDCGGGSDNVLADLVDDVFLCEKVNSTPPPRLAAAHGGIVVGAHRSNEAGHH